MLIISKNHYCHDFITEILTSPSSKLLMKKIRLQIETLMTVKIVFEHAKVHFVEVWPDYKIQTTWQYSFAPIETNNFLRYIFIHILLFILWICLFSNNFNKKYNPQKVLFYTKYWADVWNSFFVIIIWIDTDSINLKYLFKINYIGIKFWSL